MPFCPWEPNKMHALTHSHRQISVSIIAILSITRHTAIKSSHQMSMTHARRKKNTYKAANKKHWHSKHFIARFVRSSRIESHECGVYDMHHLAMEQWTVCSPHWSGIRILFINDLTVHTQNVRIRFIGGRSLARTHAKIIISKNAITANEYSLVFYICSVRVFWMANANNLVAIWCVHFFAAAATIVVACFILWPRQCGVFSLAHSAICTLAASSGSRWVDEMQKG